MDEDETLIVQSGKPIGLIKTHDKAPLVIMANCNIVGQWAKAENFYELAAEEPDLLGRPDRRRLAVHRLAGRHPGHLRNLHAHRRAPLRRRPRADGSSSPPGLGGMGGAQPLAGRMAGAAILCVEIDPERIAKRMAIGFLRAARRDPRRGAGDDRAPQARSAARSRSASLGNAAEIYPEILAPRHHPGHRHRPDLGARSRLWLRAGRALRSPKCGAAQRRSARLMSDEPRLDRATMCAPCSASSGRRGRVRQRQPHPHPGARRRRCGRLRHPDLHRSVICGRCSPAPSARSAGSRSSNDPDDIRKIDDHVLDAFPDNRIVTNWMRSRASTCRSRACRRASPGSATASARRSRSRSTRMVREGKLSGPIAFTRDHLDAGAMAHPNIMTENMQRRLATRSPTGRCSTPWRIAPRWPISSRSIPAAAAMPAT